MIVCHFWEYPPPEDLAEAREIVAAGRDAKAASSERLGHVASRLNQFDRFYRVWRDGGWREGPFDDRIESPVLSVGIAAEPPRDSVAILEQYANELRLQMFNEDSGVVHRSDGLALERERTEPRLSSAGVDMDQLGAFSSASSPTSRRRRASSAPGSGWCAASKAAFRSSASW